MPARCSPACVARLIQSVHRQLRPAALPTVPCPSARPPASSLGHTYALSASRISASASLSLAEAIFFIPDTAVEKRLKEQKAKDMKMASWLRAAAAARPAFPPRHALHSAVSARAQLGPSPSGPLVLAHGLQPARRASAAAHTVTAQPAAAARLSPAASQLTPRCQRLLAGLQRGERASLAQAITLGKVVPVFHCDGFVFTWLSWQLSQRFSSLRSPTKQTLRMLRLVLLGASPISSNLPGRVLCLFQWNRRDATSTRKVSSCWRQPRKWTRSAGKPQASAKEISGFMDGCLSLLFVRAESTHFERGFLDFSAVLTSDRAAVVSAWHFGSTGRWQEHLYRIVGQLAD